MPFCTPSLLCPEATELAELIEQRSSAAANGQSKADIDAHIWRRFGAQRAVMFTDLTGFSRRVAEFGITHFLQVIRESYRLFDPLIASHAGRIVKVDGDSMLVVFDRAPAAVLCAIAMQRVCNQYNQRRSPEEQVLLCVGLGWGDVLCIGEIDVFGAEVNAAAKLGEDVAASGEILVTNALRESASDHAYSSIAAKPAGCTQAWRLHY